MFMGLELSIINTDIRDIQQKLENNSVFLNFILIERKAIASIIIKESIAARCPNKNKNKIKTKVIKDL